jgi:hypothetical protein
MGKFAASNLKRSAPPTSNILAACCKLSAVFLCALCPMLYALNLLHSPPPLVYLILHFNPLQIRTGLKQIMPRRWAPKKHGPTNAN